MEKEVYIETHRKKKSFRYSLALKSLLCTQVCRGGGAHGKGRRSPDSGRTTAETVAGAEQAREAGGPRGRLGRCREAGRTQSDVQRQSKGSHIQNHRTQMSVCGSSPADSRDNGLG